jgi:methylmalonyl-CoA mutase cobalamin-binding subunit
VVLASLPNENHALGLQVAALAITIAGRAVRVLGPHLPSEEIIHAAEVLDAAAVGVSMSVFAQEEETARELEVIRKALPKAVEVWVGGAGSARLERLSGGIKRLPTLDDLDHAVKGLSG